MIGIKSKKNATETKPNSVHLDLIFFFKIMRSSHRLFNKDRRRFLKRKTTIQGKVFRAECFPQYWIMFVDSVKTSNFHKHKEALLKIFNLEIWAFRMLKLQYSRLQFKPHFLPSIRETKIISFIYPTKALLGWKFKKLHSKWVQFHSKRKELLFSLGWDSTWKTTAT